VTDCASCHGDPDGPGPLTAPAQGDHAYTQPSRRACASCHDDIEWTKPYVSNNLFMGPQTSDALCASCHTATTGPLSVTATHQHPLTNPALNPGTNVALTALAEAGTNNNNGKLDPGEKLRVSVTLKNDAGADLAPTELASLSYVVSGPTTNHNMVMFSSIPTFALTGTPPYTLNLPMPVYYELVGRSTAAGGQTFATAMKPHWNPATGTPLTSVLVRTATSLATTLTAPMKAMQNYADLASAAVYAVNDFVVLDDGTGSEEYRRVTLIEGSRVWFSTPASYQLFSGVRYPHAQGATFAKVTMATKSLGTDFTLDSANGALTEVSEFGAGNAVVVTYTTDFVMPATYPNSPYDSTDLDESYGKWVGKPLSAGTYTMTIMPKSQWQDQHPSIQPME